MYQKMDLKPAVLLLLCVQFFYVLSDDLLILGTACVMEDGSQGICLNQSDCPFVNTDKTKSPYTYCQYSVWKPIVCCLDCHFVENRFFDTLSMKMSLDFAFDVQLSDSEQVKHERCLQALSLQRFSCNKYEEFKDLDNSVQCSETPYDTFAVQGFDAQRNDNYHLALIGYGDNPDHAIWMCSGSVISDQYILTAAHCTSNPALGVIKFAALGVVNQMDQRKYWQVYDVVTIIVHPDYKPPSKYDDIALLGTETKIMYNHEVIPACLHRGMDTGMFALGTGWRAVEQTDPNPQVEILRGTVLKRFSDVQCMEAYPKHRHLLHGYNRNKQVCYGDGEDIDGFCEGDSAGSLQVKNNTKNAKCLYTIIGVTSYGRACGYFGTTGLYTRVDYYVPWIESITGILS